MQHNSSDRDFSGYNAAQADRPVRPLAVAAVEASAAAVDAVETAGQGQGQGADRSRGTDRGQGMGRSQGRDWSAESPLRTAIELGCGRGIEARFLAESGYTVHAYDVDPSVAAPLAALADELPVHPEIVDLAELSVLPRADLILSCASLPFVPRDDFDSLWQAMLAALRPAGILALDLFGDQDDWAGTEGTYLSRPEVEALLEGLEVIELVEEQRAGRSFSGPKHWHTYRILAQRP